MPAQDATAAQASAYPWVLRDDLGVVDRFATNYDANKQRELGMDVVYAPHPVDRDR